jgi:flagellar motility protein MotE (MotC chaperone)
MNRRTILRVTIGIVVTFGLSFLGVIAVFEYYPTAVEYYKNFSFSKDSVEVDTVYVEPYLTITKEKIDEFQRKLIEKESLKIAKDSLVKVRSKLLDSMNRIEKRISKLLDSINKVQKKLGDSRNYGESLKGKIKKLENDYNQTTVSLKTANENIKKQTDEYNKRQDTLQEKNILEFTKIYEKAKPLEVAKILEKISDKDASTILKNMPQKKAGKILELMSPEKAAAILLQGSKK